MATAAQRFTIFTFDEQYVRQLRDGSQPVEEHFAAYCGRLLMNYLAPRIKSPELREDISQETLLRALTVLRRGAGLKRPECLAGFVLAVCQNVLREFVRAQLRYSQIAEYETRPDAAPTPEAQAIDRQMQTYVARAVSRLGKRDREVLAIPLSEDRPKEVCHRLGLKHDHLRVVLHRAKAHLRAELANCSFAA